MLHLVNLEHDRFRHGVSLRIPRGKRRFPSKKETIAITIRPILIFFPSDLDRRIRARWNIVGAERFRSPADGTDWFKPVFVKYPYCSP